MASRREPLFKKRTRQLLVHNLNMNGSKSIFYCYGLSASRYVEYAAALDFLMHSVPSKAVFLELGCGHSVFPVFLQRFGATIIAMDNNRSALVWQMKKSRKLVGKSLDSVLADMRYLPLREESVHRVSCVSAIEHVPYDGDIMAAHEMGRVLKREGVCVISVPLSSGEKTYVKNHWATSIPQSLQKLFGNSLRLILVRFKVDRTSHYFERFFSERDIDDRIAKPASCSKEQQLTLKSGRKLQLIYEKIIPTGVLTLMEYIAARFLQTDPRINGAHAIILQLRKHSD